MTKFSNFNFPAFSYSVPLSKLYFKMTNFLRNVIFLCWFNEKHYLKIYGFIQTH